MTARFSTLIMAGALATTSFPVAAENSDPVTASIEVGVPVAEAWRAWTTNEGIQSFFAPGSDIELAPGGPYEVYFLPDAEPGTRGSEGTHVLGYQTERMLTVTWALPPYMPEVRPHLTPLTLYFEALDEDTTKVTVIHSGWGTGEKWEEARAYFVESWPKVLAVFKQKIEE